MAIEVKPTLSCMARCDDCGEWLTWISNKKQIVRVESMNKLNGFIISRGWEFDESGRLVCDRCLKGEGL